MGRVVLLLLAVALTIYALLDIGRTPHTQTRTMPKLLWFVLALVPVLGPVLWLLLGRPRAAKATATAPGISLRPRRRGPVAPDDDPEFLRRLGDEAWARRMEEQRRAREGDAPGGHGSSAADSPPPAPPTPQEREPRAGHEAGGPDDPGVTPA